MRFIRCDRCGKEMPWKDIRTEELAGLNPYEDVEFCDDCMRAIAAFIEQKPEVVSLDPPAAAEKPKASAKKKIDTGKLQALYEAGWPVPKIADELGCSDKAVYYHLNKLDVKGDADDGD